MISNRVYLIGILIFSMQLLGCGQKEITAQIDSDKSIYNLGDTVKITIKAISQSKIDLPFHDDLSEVIMLSSLNSSCESTSFYVSKRVSNITEHQLSLSSPLVFTINGIVIKSSLDNSLLIDFHKLGKICIPNNQSEVDISATIFTADQGGMFLLYELDTYAGNLTLSVKEIN